MPALILPLIDAVAPDVKGIARLYETRRIEHESQPVAQAEVRR